MPIKRRLYASRFYMSAKRLRDAMISITPRQKRWRRSAIALYSQFLSRGDLAFDIGANVGMRTDLFLLLGARVIAVEPQAICVALLNQKYGHDAGVVLVAKAVGRETGTAQMMVSRAHTISSMSPSWVNAVRTSGRFADYEWTGTQDVSVITLDELIATFGCPVFCKIDVEGFEHDVMAGLSSAIPALSFEFTPEMAHVGTECVDRLAELGDYEFNYSVGESMQLRLANWVRSREIKHQMKVLRTQEFGDIYARMVGRSNLGHPE